MVGYFGCRSFFVGYYFGFIGVIPNLENESETTISKQAHLLANDNSCDSKINGTKLDLSCYF